MEEKNKFLHIRITDSEKAKIEKAAEKMHLSISSYIRHILHTH